MKSYRGFTLIELTIVILLVSILAAYMLPNINLGIYRQSGFVQQATATIRYGQKQAIGSGCDINVLIAAGGCTLEWNGTPAGIGCLAAATVITNPATGLNNFCERSEPELTGDLPTQIRFNNIGGPIAIIGDLIINLGARTITVEPVTGFTHE